MFSGWQYLTTWEQIEWALAPIGQCVLGLTARASLGVMLQGCGGESCGGGICAVVPGTLAGLCWKAAVAIVASAAALSY
jgi:hypothetical protein